MAEDTKIRDGVHQVDTGPVALDRAVRAAHPGSSWNDARRAITSGKVSVDGAVVRDSTHPIDAGNVITVRMAAPKQPRVALTNAIVHVDAQIVVVRKPPGILSVPDERVQRGTLARRIGEQLRRRRGRDVPLGIVQRLDVDTSGLIVFARTADAREALKEQFQARTVERHYVALVAGEAQDKTIRSHLFEHKNGKRASTRHKHLGKFACTHVRVDRRLRGATLVSCKLETGRTHQIRIHLSEDGHPLLGDSRYARRRIDTPPAPRVMLHAASLGFRHPQSGEDLHFEEPLPPDMQAVLNELIREDS